MKQVILIRKDLKMRRGKEIAQGSHASMAFILRNYVDEAANKIDLTEWLKGGQTKICLQIHSEEELLELHKKALESGLEANYITDAGRTEFNGVPTKTCLAIGPNNSEYIDKITKHLKLY
jgi:PTH2 family peptidyl-tRNA hydrolase